MRHYRDVLHTLCIPGHLNPLIYSVTPAFSLQQPIADHIWIMQPPFFLQPPLHTRIHTQKHTSLLHSQFNPGVWWGPWLGSLRVLMANGADIVMSDQSSCLPSQQHISHSYRFSPLAQAEDLDAYLMFIFYRSRLSGPVRKAKSLKGGKVHVKPAPAW